MPEEVAALQVRLEASTARFERSLQRAERQMSRRSKAIERQAQGLDKKLSNVGARFGKNLILRATAAVGAIATVSKVINDVVRNGDKFKVLEARFSALTGSAERGRAVFSGVLDIVSRTGVSIDDVAASITRFTLAAQSIGATDDQVRQLTENIVKLGQIGGSTQQEIASGAVQLAQALASGRLQGDELRSILENMPLVARAIAEGLGVGVGQLREMGAEGELTARKVFDAILSKTDEVEDRFGELPVTLDRAAGQLAGAWAKFTSELDNSLGVSEALVAVLQKATALLNEITRVDGPDEILVADIARLQEMEARLGTVTGPFRERIQTGIDELRASISERVRQNSVVKTSAPAATQVASTPTRSSRARSGGGGRGRSTPQLDRDSAADFVQSVQRRIEALTEERAAIGLTDGALVSYRAKLEAARFEQELNEIAARENTEVTAEQRQEVSQLADVFVILTENIQREKQAMEEASRAAEELQASQQEFVEGVGSALSSAISQANSFDDALKRIALSLAELAINDLFKGSGSAILSGLGAFGGGIFGSSSGGFLSGGGFFGDVSSFVPAFANGGAFRSGRVIPFANGGVVSGPTAFAMQNATGLMGEAGPEAIMPLSRGPDGKLGVKAAGGGQPMNFTIDARGAQQGVAEQIQRVMRRELPSILEQQRRRGGGL